MRPLLGAALFSLILAGCGDIMREEAVVDGLTTSQWIERTESEDLEVKRDAAGKLGELGPEEADRTVPVLIQLMKDPDPYVRLFALRSVKALGPKARRAAGTVARLVNDKEIYIAREAMRVYKDLEFSKMGGLPKS